MINTEISQNGYNGVLLCPTITGSVTMTKCNFARNGKRDINNMCGEQCVVTINGVVQSHANQQQRFFEGMSEIEELGKHAVETLGPSRPTMK